MTIFRDRRKHRMCIQSGLIGLVALFWFIGLAYGEAITEHAPEIMAGQWWIIGGLLGIIQVIILMFYAYSQNVSSRTIRSLIDSIQELNEKVDRKEVLLLETRKVLLELHGEHKVMMDRCAHVNRMVNHDDKLS